METDLELATLKAAELFNLITTLEAQVRGGALSPEEKELNLSKIQTYIAILSERLGLISIGLESIKFNLQLGIAFSAIKETQRLSKAITEAAQALPSSHQIESVRADISDLLRRTQLNGNTTSI
jgi:hypothetical protein